jgi:ABC-2 type transport system permease protein
MRPALEIARVNVLRLLRERENLFFIFLLPLILIVTLGAAFGGSGTSRLGVVAVGAGPLGDELVSAIGSGELAVEIRQREDMGQLVADVEDGRLAAGLLIPPGYDQALRAGESVELEVVGRPDGAVGALRQGLAAAVARQSAQVRAAHLAAEHAGIGFEAALEQARATQATLPGISLEQTTVGEATFPAIENPFALGAQSQTVLFMFLTSLTAATQLVLTRQLGVSRRMLATPTSVRAILLGELLGRFAVAMVQGLFVVMTSALLFGVAWGSLPAAFTVVVLFALVGTGAAMVVGVLARNPDQAGSAGVVVGLVLAALGGAMIPAELFTEPISTLARLTPHYWAIDAFRDLAFLGAGVTDIVAQLAILAAFALALVAIGTWGLRRSLTRG